MQTDRQTNRRRTEIQTDRNTDRQNYRQTEIQTERQTVSSCLQGKSEKYVIIMVFQYNKLNNELGTYMHKS